ncbi:SDR family oxidoreductase [Rhizobium leguminosarum]|uniref:SDR family oxidoreductase n=1 Tax=Rhizobium leguminosarum TaxID=384 RepID=UPI001C988670|nr:SDR family oxidoreductase [Rhizobium leguminosarum]MBY5394882.1 SDR family oxidoreductase [Rhizobium leguminosarum]
MTTLWASSAIHLMDGWDEPTSAFDFADPLTDEIAWYPSQIKTAHSSSWAQKCLVSDPIGTNREVLIVEAVAGRSTSKTVIDLRSIKTAVTSNGHESEPLLAQIRWSTLEQVGKIPSSEILLHAAVTKRFSIVLSCPELLDLATTIHTAEHLNAIFAPRLVPSNHILSAVDFVKLGDITSNSATSYAIIAADRIVCWSNDKTVCETTAAHITRCLSSLVGTEDFVAHPFRHHTGTVDDLLILRGRIARNRRQIIVSHPGNLTPRFLDDAIYDQIEIASARGPVSWVSKTSDVLGIGRSRYDARRAAEAEIRRLRTNVAYGLRAGRQGWGSWEAQGEVSDLTQELEGRVALVTGAASGIGRQVAFGLAQRGAHLVLVDRAREDLRTVVEAIDAMHPDSVEMMAGDVTDSAVVSAAFQHCVLAFGGIDIVVSCAGVGATGYLRDITEEEWHACINANATAHFLVTRNALRMFERQSLGGSIVYVASKTAIAPGLAFGAYAIAKAAELQIARVAAIEGGEFGVRSNVVNPGALFGGSQFWSSEISEERASIHKIRPEQLADYYSKRNLLRRSITCADVAEAVAFLASERSAATSGCIISVDGGDDSAFPR